jgi:hypothetical protein
MQTGLVRLKTIRTRSARFAIEFNSKFSKAFYLLTEVQYETKSNLMQKCAAASSV